MMQNQYSNISGVEALWTTTLCEGGYNGFAAPRYQVNVTGGTVAANIPRPRHWDPALTLSPIHASVAVNRAGGWPWCSAEHHAKPAIKYAGRLGDPVNTLSLTEQLDPGAGTRVNTRWGDYGDTSTGRLHFLVYQRVLCRRRGELPDSDRVLHVSACTRSEMAGQFRVRSPQHWRRSDQRATGFREQDHDD
jgi:hypothetical protein